MAFNLRLEIDFQYRIGIVGVLWQAREVCHSLFCNIDVTSEFFV